MYEIFPSVYAMCETMLYNAEEKDASGIIYKAKPFSLRNVLVKRFMQEPNRMSISSIKFSRMHMQAA